MIDHDAFHLPVICPHCESDQIHYVKTIGLTPDPEAIVKTKNPCVKCGEPLHTANRVKDLKEKTKETLALRAVQGKNTPAVYFEDEKGDHYTIDMKNPLDFGEVEAGQSKVITVYIDNEATGSPTDDLDRPIIDGVEGTTQIGTPEETYEAISFGPDGETFYDPWRHDDPKPLMDPIPADGDGGRRVLVCCKWSPPEATSTGSKAWGIQISGVYT
ncbi:MAG: hypothetical protein GTN80_09030 [Nitrososphaeria archaeon]|nr:hypothetical protein [Nitrososphaeria archaeon]NIN53309.1 hypothetical protein [Nitrososphaeria archaeon]NIQ33762.1 hypothetical protein [Nitrososphaeria archaeon]